MRCDRFSNEIKETRGVRTRCYSYELVVAVDDLELAILDDEPEVVVILQLGSRDQNVLRLGHDEDVALSASDCQSLELRGLYYIEKGTNLSASDCQSLELRGLKTRALRLGPLAKVPRSGCTTVPFLHCKHPL